MYYNSIRTQPVRTLQNIDAHHAHSQKNSYLRMQKYPTNDNLFEVNSRLRNLSLSGPDRPSKFRNTNFGGYKTISPVDAEKSVGVRTSNDKITLDKTFDGTVDRPVGKLSPDNSPEREYENPYHRIETIHTERRNKRRGTHKCPITSYGLILFLYDDSHNNTKSHSVTDTEADTTSDQIKVLLYKRRDSYEYMDFMRGFWETDEDVLELFRLMDSNEKDRILSHDFNELWKDLWVYSSGCLHNYEKARTKFMLIQPRLSNIVSQSDRNQPRLVGPSWGFPKGKKNNNREHNLTCALREFQEETKIDSKTIKVLDTETLVENIKTGDGKVYRTYYFIGVTKSDELSSRTYTPECIRKSMVSEEADDVGWFTTEEADKVLCQQRKRLLSSAINCVKKYNFNS